MPSTDKPFHDCPLSTAWREFARAFDGLLGVLLWKAIWRRVYRFPAWWQAGIVCSLGDRYAAWAASSEELCRGVRFTYLAGHITESVWWRLKDVWRETWRPAP